MDISGIYRPGPLRRGAIAVLLTFVLTAVPSYLATWDPSTGTHADPDTAAPGAIAATRGEDITVPYLSLIHI